MPVRKLSAEFLGTAVLVFIVVGSGINAETMSTDGTVTLAAHALAVGAGLGALIAFLGPVSGAHFNPSVTIGFRLTDAIRSSTAAAYVGVQVTGGVAGAVVAHWTFSEAAVMISQTRREGFGLVLAEFAATFVLVLLILGLVRSGRITAVAPAVGAWVTAIVLATASTGFANPAVTVARVITDSYTGIAPQDALVYVLAQLAAGIVAAWVALAMFPENQSSQHDRTEVPT